MGVLSDERRRTLLRSQFAIPSKNPGSGSYPIPDIEHARVALARVAQHGTMREQEEVARAVYKKFPSLKK